MLSKIDELLDNGFLAASTEYRDWLAGRGIEHVYLTGCGDSAFAGLAATNIFTPQ